MSSRMAPCSSCTRREQFGLACCLSERLGGLSVESTGGPAGGRHGPFPWSRVGGQIGLACCLSERLGGLSVESTGGPAGGRHGPFPWSRVGGQFGLTCCLSERLGGLPVESTGGPASEPSPVQLRGGSTCWCNENTNNESQHRQQQRPKFTTCKNYENAQTPNTWHVMTQRHQKQRLKFPTCENYKKMIEHQALGT